MFDSRKFLYILGLLESLLLKIVVSMLGLTSLRLVERSHTSGCGRARPFGDGRRSGEGGGHAGALVAGLLSDRSMGAGSGVRARVVKSRGAGPAGDASSSGSLALRSLPTLLRRLPSTWSHFWIWRRWMPYFRAVARWLPLQSASFLYESSTCSLKWGAKILRDPMPALPSPLPTRFSTEFRPCAILTTRKLPQTLEKQRK